ncbi:hypothetical protein [Schlesneria paludicola]|uniref:hypothetical protein n=1 Tax=Schlesneria paludicola TaxID=360056 RepID=UPI00029A02D6|nr:hypothetical protein [Schlesneria paludicola]
MLISKSCRMFLAAAAVAVMAPASQAGCNCSVPPSPVVSTYTPTSAAAWGGAPGYAGSPGGYGATAVGTGPSAYDDYNSAGPHWAPGGYEPRVGSPAYYHDPAGGQYVVTGNPYYDHFGPGFHRQDLHGHYRFPYYNYRAPWYYPGRAVYNRNTNFPW